MLKTVSTLPLHIIHLLKITSFRITRLSIINTEFKDAVHTKKKKKKKEKKKANLLGTLLAPTPFQGNTELSARCKHV